MVNEGWSFHDLMVMRARDFGFWLDHQSQHAKRQMEASKTK
jgi:hypothetical protein